jgi:hypothetical protein
LFEWDPRIKDYTGRMLTSEITSLVDDFQGLAPGYVAFGLDYELLEQGHGYPVNPSAGWY